MTRKDLAELTGIRHSTIGELYNEFAPRVSFDHLDRICEALGCSLCELLEYVPNSKTHTGKDLIVEQHGNQKKQKKL